MFIKLTNAYPPDDGSRPHFILNAYQITWVNRVPAVEGSKEHTDVFIPGTSAPFMVEETVEQIEDLIHDAAIGRAIGMSINTRSKAGAA